MVDATRLGAWLRSGEGLGWLAAGTTMPNSLYRMPFVLFLACVFCYSCSFLFVVFDCLCFPLLSLELGRCSSDLFLSSRPRTELATTYIPGYMVEARSVNVKKTTTTITVVFLFLWRVVRRAFFPFRMMVFFYLVATGWIFYISYRYVIIQSINKL